MPIIALPATLAPAAAAGFPAAADLILSELRGAVASVDPAALEDAIALLLGADRILAAGAGRSRLALAMGAMRLMHLGLAVHIAGEVTAPPIGAGDVLLAASGSGETQGIVHAAEVAKRTGATVIALTAAPESRLAKLATVLLWLKAAGKLDRSGMASRQYGGSLFEQAVLLTLDAICHALWQASGVEASALWAR